MQYLPFSNASETRWLMFRLCVYCHKIKSTFGLLAIHLVVYTSTVHLCEGE